MHLNLVLADKSELILVIAIPVLTGSAYIPRWSE